MYFSDQVAYRTLGCFESGDDSHKHQKFIHLLMDESDNFFWVNE